MEWNTKARGTEPQPIGILVQRLNLRVKKWLNSKEITYTFLPLAHRQWQHDHAENNNKPRDEAELISEPLGDSERNEPCHGCLHCGALLLTKTPANHPSNRKQTSCVHTKTLFLNYLGSPNTHASHTVFRVHVQPIFYSHGGRSCNPRESSRSLHSEPAGLGPSQQWIPRREEG